MCDLMVKFVIGVLFLDFPTTCNVVTIRCHCWSEENCLSEQKTSTSSWMMLQLRSSASVESTPLLLRPNKLVSRSTGVNVTSSWAKVSAQWSVAIELMWYMFLCSPAGGAASSVLRRKSQTGPEAEDHSSWRRSSGCQDGTFLFFWSNNFEFSSLNPW